jgi:hypothetical protein
MVPTAPAAVSSRLQGTEVLYQSVRQADGAAILAPADWAASWMDPDPMIRLGTWAVRDAEALMGTAAARDEPIGCCLQVDLRAERNIFVGRSFDP